MTEGFLTGLLGFIGKWFTSPGRVQVMKMAEEAALLGQNAMTSLRESHAEQVRLWDEMRALREAMTLEVQELREQEAECQRRMRKCQDQVDMLTARIAELERTH